MPGFQSSRVSFQPALHGPMDMHTKGRGGPGRSEKGIHPMFNALKTRHIQERANYERMIKVKDPRRAVEGLYPTFDSLKLLGAENDANYLDSFMSPKHRYGGGDDHENRHRARSSSHTNRKRNNRQSMNMDVLAKTLLGSLRSAASEENIYESTEAINYRKTMEEMDKQEKIRDVCKTGHPLFDALRVKNALSRPLRKESHMSSMYNLNTLTSSRPKMVRQHSHPSGTSDGNSNSNSSSGSGDEFDYMQKPNHRFSRKAVISTAATTERRGHHHKHSRHEHGTHRPSHHGSHHHSHHRNSESDDEWAIPRPKLMELTSSKSRHRRTGASAARIPSSVSSGPEESDSSSKSTGLR